MSFRRFAWGVLAWNVLVILWGAVVRVTGSGAGCGRDWPLCRDAILPADAAGATLVELSHRATSGLAFLAVVALVVWAWRAFPRRHPARAAAGWSLVFMIGEAAIGAGLVLFELVGENDSLTRAAVMSAHLCNTFLLLAALVACAFWGEADPGRGRLARRGRLAALAAGALAAMVVVGMSGGVAALGDTLFPPESHGAALRLSAASHVLVQLRLLHPLLAFAGAAFLLYLVGAVRAAGDPEAKRHANVLSLLVVAQLAVGAANVALLAPAWMQVLHLLVADLLWIALVLTCLAALAPRAAPVAPTTATATAAGRAAAAPGAAR